MVNIFKQTIKRLFEKLDATSDITFLYDCMRLHPIMFLNEYKELMREELIKRNICPECREYLVDKACPKCKILFDEEV